MERFRNMLQSQGLGGLGSQPGTDNTQLIDNSETVYISSLALLKMLRHGRAGVPMEVMGLMLGEFVDDFTVRVVDVFAMPQSGTGVSVEAVDPVFQMKMMDMLRQTGRPEAVVGWYHSHPGFGCWLSSVDINTQQSFEQLTPRAVAVVVDPIQSVKGKVVIDAFRLINPQSLMLGQEPRQSTSNLGHLNKPSIQALIHGLNRHYYSIGINYRKTALEENMLMNLHKHVWTEALEMNDFRHEGDCNKERLERLVSLAEGYEKRVKEETELTKDQLKTRYVGKLDPKKHLEDVGQQLIEDNIVSVSRQMIDKEATMPKKDGPAGGKDQANGDSMDVEEELRTSSTAGLFNFPLQSPLDFEEESAGRSNGRFSTIEALRRFFGRIGHHFEDMASPSSRTSDLNGNQPMLHTTSCEPSTYIARAEAVSPSDSDQQSPSSSVARPDMSSASTCQVLHRIGQTFSHVQYAVCGDAAMVAYGHPARPASHISIICPVYAQEVMKSWAAATSGMLNYAGEPDTLGVADEDGRVWPVKMRTMAFERSFETLPTVSFRLGSDSSLTTVLTMPALVNEIALSYVIDRHTEEEGFLDDLAADLAWLLREMIQDSSPEQKLNAEDAPAIGKPIFWFDFTDTYPELAGLFYDAGYRPEGSQGDASQVSEAAPAGSQPLPSREGILRGRRRSGGGSDAELRRQVRDGPNLTRAELRRVIRDHHGSSRRRSSSRGSSEDQARKPGSFRHGTRKKRQRKETPSSVVSFGEKISNFLFGRPDASRRKGSDR
ncbi:Mov34/MPN/PAD-1 family protein [Colletotrichum orchidophilum]|uniref:Mov34/MPN/PAD-1 family protein n=1 Tax=Colletotrichum orchidophilum TaxID=1209926 RepID=A0A1G4AUV6_9PEZI|nr:Mov34/MPN/PAD-1 family protein [Colletotrichum orchidophilum]OHE92924.1 Mov34/MPN/PAD-1 family protein [Colletotrichum orchidophilum]